jgi:ribosomal protein S4E
VKVVQGEHKGETGQVVFYRTEGDGGRLTLLLADGKTIYVSHDEIDFKFEAFEITLGMEAEERAYVQELSRQMRDGECHS